MADNGKKGKQTKKRFTWEDGLVRELLRMRFHDSDVVNRIRLADTNVKKRLAWNYFATRLSDETKIVFTGKQVKDKYTKLKCEYRANKGAVTDTGNVGRLQEDALWDILNDAFADRTGIAGTSLGDSEAPARNANDTLSADGESDDSDDDSSTAPGPTQPSPSKDRRPAVALLADAMQAGMESIANSMAAQPAPATSHQDLISVLTGQHQQTMQIMAQQLQLLQAIVQRSAS